MSSPRKDQCTVCAGLGVRLVNLAPCPACAGTGLTPPPVAPTDDMRPALAEAFHDYARNALQRGDRHGHGIWEAAADLAVGFIPVRRR
jgi:hypothetical protein